MKKFIPREKLGRKARKQLDGERRATWILSPVTKKVESKKRYSRKKKTHDRDDDYGMVFLWKYRAIKVVSWRANFVPGADADFAGLLGSSAWKTVQWTAFSENGLASPGGKSRNLHQMTGAKGTARCAAVLCGSSLYAGILKPGMAPISPCLIPGIVVQ